jgi:DNA-binding winged helix-turn-helix (wHTH) protein
VTDCEGTVFYFGQWRVDPSSNSLEQADQRRQLEPRAMDVLVALCHSANTVLSTEQLLQQCWGSTAYGDSPVYKTIAQLRRLLDDSPSNPTYIETIRKRGYRAVAEVRLPASVAEPGSWTHGSPFCGLRPFQADRATLFFGRANAIAALGAVVARQAATHRALLLVLGPSGSGKTSLIRAGLLPRLHDPLQAGALCLADSAELDLGELSEGQLFAGLAGAMLDWQLESGPLFPGSSADTLGTRLTQNCAGVIAELKVAMATCPTLGAARLLLFLDRFEAIFTQASITAAQRASFIEVLDALARSGQVIVILACRNDFYPQIAAHPALLESKDSGGHFDVEAPTPHEIAQMIRLPALAANLSFGVDVSSQERLDDLLCRAAGTMADALPLLQYTLEELYRLRSADGELCIETYHRMGGIDGAIGVRAEELFAALGERPQAALPRVLSLLVTVSSDNGAATSRRSPWSALNAQAERELVTALVEARLFVSELVDAEAGFGVAHEALLRRWTRLSDWIAAHRDNLRTRARVAQVSARWVAEGRRVDLLLPRGKQLSEARVLLETPGLYLTPDERALIGASNRRARWRRRASVGAVILIVTLAMVASLLGARAALAERQAQQKRVQAEGLMGYMLGDFADKLRPLGRIDLLDSVSAKALEYLAEADTDALGPASLTHHAKALALLGELRIARGDSRGANTALLAGQTILQKQLLGRVGDPELLTQLGANSFWLGQIAFDKSDWDGAQQYFTRYRRYADQVSALAPTNVDAWIEQSYAQNSLGSLALRRGDPRTAQAAFQVSIALKTKALSHKHDPALAAELADSLSWAGSSAEASGNLSAAQAWYDGELRIVSALRQGAPGNLLWIKKASVALHHRAALKLVRGADQDALDDYRTANTLLREIVQAEPLNRQWQSNLILGQLEALQIEAGHRITGATLPELSELVDKSAALVALDPMNADWVRLAALAQQRTAAALFKANRRPAAMAAADQAVHLLQGAYGRNKMDTRARALLATTLLLRAELRLGAGAEYRADCRAVISLLGPQAAASSDLQVLDPWVRSHQCIAEGAAVINTVAWLDQIGYRAQAYRNSSLTHH